jgi:hypothetical protein
MPYTFWYSGILIGESDMEERPNGRRHRAGAFRPTAYGLEIFPRLTGILSAGHALKMHLDANGLSPDTMDAREIEAVMDSTPAGQKILDIGRTLCDVEMRGPSGGKLEFESIAFTDLREFERLARELGTESAEEVADLPPGTPQYVVSATLCRKASARSF